MKVKELIERLLKLNLNTEVQTEGCDCYGDVQDVTIDSDCVMLWRTKQADHLDRGDER